MLCEKLSARTVEIGLVPLGAFGMSAFLFDLYFARSGTVAAAGLDIAGFLQQDGSWRIVLDLLGIGVFTGFFVVRSEEHTSELQSLMRNSYAVFCLKKKNTTTNKHRCKTVS